MRILIMIVMFYVFCHGSEQVDVKYSILRISGKAITTNGLIDFQRWRNNDFPFCEPISIKVNGVARHYEAVGSFVFEITTQERRDELHSRVVIEANAGRDLAIIKRRVHYQGRMLKYAERVCADGRTMDLAGQSDDAIRGFRFRQYLIFLVKARYLGQSSYDFVVYDIDNDEFAVQRTVGVWPEVMMFRASEASPNPRNKTENP